MRSIDLTIMYEVPFVGLMDATSQKPNRSRTLLINVVMIVALSQYDIPLLATIETIVKGLFTEFLCQHRLVVKINSDPTSKDPSFHISQVYPTSTWHLTRRGAGFQIRLI
jgi:hypothetical protein